MNDVRFGDAVATPDGYFGIVTEFDEEGVVKVVYREASIKLFGPTFGWYTKEDLTVQPDDV